jgi:uroporphyrinogen-III synthase
MALPLAGKAILIARPRHQAAGLAERIRVAGGEALVFPSLEIEPVAPDAQACEVLSRLASFDLAVFVSANAVQQAMPLLRALGGWPQRLTAAAVGQATASALQLQGVERVLTPRDGADSQALLALPQLQEMQGRQVIVFRGVGGRELLADTLRSRGAQVAYVECYRRVRPAIDAAPMAGRLAGGQLHATLVASGEALANLLELLPAPQRPLLLELPLVVTHPNVARAAGGLGFRRVAVASGGESELFQALLVALGGPR